MMLAERRPSVWARGDSVHRTLHGDLEPQQRLSAAPAVPSLSGLVLAQRQAMEEDGGIGLDISGSIASA